ncbi:MAG TPA: hypothetical protein VFO99_04750 [Pyrinomonadaceae bacterium]|nr:hypothetical protein [Pyrinomonadaceae bacterium]
MTFTRPLLIAMLVAAGFLFTGQGLYNAPAAKAYQDSKSGTTTGFPTGTVCKKSGTYRASNKYLENIIVVAEGEIFPPFSDGTKTIWYPRSSSTKNQ